MNAIKEMAELKQQDNEEEDKESKKDRDSDIGSDISDKADGKVNEKRNKEKGAVDFTRRSLKNRVNYFRYSFLSNSLAKMISSIDRS